MKNVLHASYGWLNALDEDGICKSEYVEATNCSRQPMPASDNATIVTKL